MDTATYDAKMSSAKERYNPFWQYELAGVLGGDSLFFRCQKDGTFFVSDQMGIIPSRNTWRVLVEDVNRFYATISDEEIDLTNWETLAGLHRPSRPTSSAPRKRQPIPGHVYLMRAPGDYYKIGVSTNPTARHKQLAKGCPGLELICSGFFEDSYGAEADYHARYAKSRATGEWFVLEADEFMEVQRSLTAGEGPQ